MAHTAGDDTGDIDELTEAGHDLLDEYAASGDVSCLRQALAAYEQALALLPPDEENWPFLSNLGNCLRLVHEQSGDPLPLSRTITVLKEASVQVGPGTEDQALVLDNLALALRARFTLTGAGADLRWAVGLHGVAVDACQDGPELSRYLNNLAGALRELHSYTGNLAYLERAIAGFESAIAATAPGSPELSRHLSNLAGALGSQYRASGNQTLLSRAVDAARAALTVPGADVTDRGRMLSTLADLLLERAEATDNSLDDLNEAVEVIRAAADGAGPHTRQHTLWLSNLGEALLARFERTSAEADLDESISLLEHVTGLTAEDPARPGPSGSGLAGALGARYLFRGDRADLDRAVELATAAVASIPTDAATAAFAATRRHTLGMLLRRLYEATGELGHLQTAARWFSEAAAVAPPRSPVMARMQAALGLALHGIYTRTGEFPLLEDALSKYRQALAITRPDNPARAIYLDNLGMALLDRYERTGGVDDLDESVRLLYLAKEATPGESGQLAGTLNNLGTALWNRHVHRPRGEDLHKALEAYEQAVQHTAANAPDAAIYLDNLANALGDRYRLTGDSGDLDRAISAHQQALAGLPDGAPERLRIRTNLAVSLLTRYHDDRPEGQPDERDLDLAIEILEDIVAVTPPGAPALVNRLNSLGVGLKYRFQRDADPADLDQGRDALSLASGPQGARDVRWSLAAATTLAGWASERGEWDSAASAFRTAMATAENYLRAQLARDSTEAAIRGIGGLYADAVHALTQAGQPAEAIVAAERGRAVLLSETLDRERALSALRTIADGEELAPLAERFRRTAARVRALTGITHSRG